MAAHSFVMSTLSTTRMGSIELASRETIDALAKYDVHVNELSKDVSSVVSELLCLEMQIRAPCNPPKDTTT
jgi:hypothetical protein